VVHRNNEILERRLIRKSMKIYADDEHEG
jgi:hypothetical protein